MFVSETNPHNVDFKDEYPADFEDSEDDAENTQIRASDCILITGKIEQEAASLEIYVYEEKDYNLFVHHDIILNSFPVSLEWLCCDFSGAESNDLPRANRAIVGLMTPEIEIWDLDFMDPVEPLSVLGGKSGHKDSVTALALHDRRPNLLASASADKFVKFWDLQSEKVVLSSSQFEDRVQGVAWDIQNESVVFTFSGNNTFKIFDAREQNSVATFSVDFGIENFACCPVDASKLFFSSDDGFIYAFDLKQRQMMKDLHTKAHLKAIPSIVCNSLGHVITNSLDGFVKIYNAADLSFVAQQKTDLGMLLSSSIHPENPHLFACGSSKSEVVVWDFTNDLPKKSN